MAFQDLGRASPQQRRLAMPDPQPWQHEVELAEMQVRLVEKEAEIERLRDLVRSGVGKLTADAQALRVSSAIVSRQVNTMKSSIADEMHDAGRTTRKLVVRMSESLRATAVHYEDVGKDKMKPKLDQLQSQISDLEAAKWQLEIDLAARDGDLATREEHLQQEKAESLRLRNANQKLRDEMEAAASAHEHAMTMKEAELARLQSSVSRELYRVLDEVHQIKEADSSSPSRSRSRGNSPSLPLSPTLAADAAPSDSPVTEPVIPLSPHSPIIPANALKSAFESPQDWAQIETLAREQPELLRVPCDNEGAGMLALHLCVIRQAPLNVTRAVFEQNPAAIGIKDKARGATPIELIAEVETAETTSAGQERAAQSGTARGNGQPSVNQAAGHNLTATYLRAAYAMMEATRNGEMDVLEAYKSLVRTIHSTPPIGWS
eukprot:COSAG02_NODE_2651_length_8325_cov_5.663506_7_plen_433_part_00